MPRHTRNIDHVNNFPLWSPEDVAERFVDALGTGDLEIAERLLAKDVEYVRNWSRPIRGRGAVARYLQRHRQFQVVLESVTRTGDGVALTERVAVADRGPLRMQLWVCGRFEVHDHRIVSWRDTVEIAEVAKAAARAVAGTVYAPARPRLPRAAV